MCSDLSRRARNVSHGGSFLGMASPLATFGSTGPDSVQLLAFSIVVYNGYASNSRGADRPAHKSQCNKPSSPEQYVSARHVGNDLID
jgi:hypothetical protein